jgi:hypothetical protein
VEVEVEEVLVVELLLEHQEDLEEEDQMMDLEHWNRK